LLLPNAIAGSAANMSQANQVQRHQKMPSGGGAGNSNHFSTGE